MVIYSNYGERPPKNIEHNNGPSLVKTAGYVPAKEQIANLRASGVNLQAYRERMYMYKDNSLAERDRGMPDDIFQDRMDVMDKEREFVAEMASKAPESPTKASDEAKTEESPKADEGGSAATDDGGAEA